MKLIMNGINGHYLRNITENSIDKVEEVLAAVAYATDSSLLFDWCWQNRIPLKFYGRLDDNVAVNINILDTFLKRKSANFVCRLVQYHHAKVIWWRGIGLYIGSANLSNSAWYKNVEAGCFFPEDEITNDMASDIQKLFATLETNSTHLTEEVLVEMKKRSEALDKSAINNHSFWDSPSFVKWDGLVQTPAKKAMDLKKQEFLVEWHSTLQYLRDIGEQISRPENRPQWINNLAPNGTQADQFLHAHYYQRTFDGRRADYERFFEKNKGRQDMALIEAINWWRNLPQAPNQEDLMLNETAPYLRNALSANSLDVMDEDSFYEVCLRVHSIRDYSRRVPNRKVGLPDGVQYNIDEKVTALSKHIWNNPFGGIRVNELLISLFYGGANEQLPERLWKAVDEVDCLGISSLGELVGWALPDEFPPRNGRTSKALRSLGYDVTVHVG